MRKVHLQKRLFLRSFFQQTITTSNGDCLGLPGLRVDQAQHSRCQGALYIYYIIMSFQGQELDDSQFQIRFTQENEYPEIYSATKPYAPIKPSTMNAFTVEFDMRSRITNCNSSVARMTPCLEKAYNNLFGSDYNNMVSSQKYDTNIYLLLLLSGVFPTLGKKDGQFVTNST